MINNYQYKNINGLQIPLYNEDAFTKLKIAGELAFKTLEYIRPFVKEGITTLELNDLCHDFIIKNNAKPATLNYNGYPKSSCISLNHEICHGIPSSKKLISGDILNIDITVIVDGYFGDISEMFWVNKISPKAKKLIEITNQCLYGAISILKPGLCISEIGKTISHIAHENNFSVVEDFCGHGIGHKFHQEPNILHYENNYQLTLEKGMVFTIEPMINAGKKHTKMLSNSWTAITRDFSLSAQAEHTIGITDNGYIIFTQKHHE